MDRTELLNPACQALMVSAPASGQGKTSVTAAIARAARQAGQRVRVFKTGPDYLDPMILARASGAPVYQLDLFMGGLAHCQRLLAEAAAASDLVLVEGVMGLFDGEPSSADLAAAFGLPVLVVLDASAMAQTFAALALGLARYRSDVRVAGVVANRVGSEGHARLLGAGLPADLPLVAALKRQPELALPERHLGLVQALELPALDAQLDAWAQAWRDGEALGSGGGLAAARLPLRLAPPAPEPLPRTLAGRRIAIARDACFSFIYPANVDLLRALGAETLFFSPLAGDALPDCDALWLPGGYPELHAQSLAARPGFFAALRAHHAAGKPLLAECGGMLALLESLTDAEGKTWPLAGLLPGSGRMQARLSALGLQAVAWPESAPGTELRGHSFHYSTLQTPLAPLAQARNPNGGATREALYGQGRLRASYIHHYFPSDPAAVAAFFAAGHAGPAA
ncbi:cobyrinate a,c-diamide synthase [Pelomonas sp. CA6]|uniref:cobyrinate a,c-diamide synthase n=1 Tax=Pelomonas sp. CA6 TaxID=2907999 RepID=UPI001F4C1B50|nr:cobyrinate a,c-diamide synthase [Pelomonas sp. CA6]MCH7344502.1 cobyrinate a,c-diamide synthase [Pelomonas sp. CA6]